MTYGRHPLSNGHVLNGKFGTYRVVKNLSSSGKHAQLYQVTPITSSGHIHLAKFFNIPNIQEYPRNAEGLGTKDQREFKRFKKEARFLRLFNHASIVGYVDEYLDMAKGDSNECFYVMEYLSGKSLQDYIRDQSIPGNPIDIAIGAASALVELERKKVIHRDIHPGNIFLSRDIPKLIDFGCAIGGGITRPYSYDGEYRNTGFAGVLHRAPEAINPSEATPGSDIYSFGITLLELFNTRLPTPSERQQRQRWIDGSLAKLSSRRQEVASLIRRMVHFEASQRPAITEVHRNLRKLSAQKPHRKPTFHATEWERREPISKKPESDTELKDLALAGTAILGYFLVKEVGIPFVKEFGIPWVEKFLQKRQISSQPRTTPPTKLKIEAVAFDIDNTLAHKAKESDDFLSLPPGNSYLSPATVDSLKRISGKVPVVLITSRRATNYYDIQEILPHQYAVFESGGVIFEHLKGRISYPGSDPGELEKVWRFEERLKEKGYRTNREGRLASFRIIREENPGIRKADIEELLDENIRLVTNEPYWDFVLKEAGKKNAAIHVFGQLGLAISQGVFVGDDINDLELLKFIGVPMTFSTSKKSVCEAVEKNGGYVTKRAEHVGIADILKRIELYLAFLPEMA